MANSQKILHDSSIPNSTSLTIKKGRSDHRQLRTATRVILQLFSAEWLPKQAAKMARRLRIEYAGAVCHVMAQGNRVQVFCADDGERNMWLGLPPRGGT
jgi:hypothetical protein